MICSDDRVALEDCHLGSWKSKQQGCYWIEIGHPSAFHQGPGSVSNGDPSDSVSPSLFGGDPRSASATTRQNRCDDGGDVVVGG